MRTTEEIAQLWADRTETIRTQPYQQARQAPRVYAESIHNAFNAAAADRDALPALIAHLAGVLAAMQALAERQPEPDPEGGDAGKPRSVGRVR